MKDMLKAPFLTEMIRTQTNMYAHGWDERNGGNISLMLDEKDAAEYVNVNKVIRARPTGFSQPELNGKGPASISRTLSTHRRRTWDLFALRTGDRQRSFSGALRTAEGSPASFRPT